MLDRLRYNYVNNALNTLLINFVLICYIVEVIIVIARLLNPNKYYSIAT